MSSDYPHDWNSRRKEVYDRDNHTCQNCGAKGGRNGVADLHAHHIVPKKKGGTHALSNLKTMCSVCHKAIHGEHQAPTADLDREINTNDLTIRNTKQLVKFSSGIFDSYKQVFSHDICQGNLALDSKTNWDVKQELYIQRLVLSDHVEVNPTNPKEREVVRNLLTLQLQVVQTLIGMAERLEEYEESVLDQNCPSCGSTQDFTSKYCGSCGEELPVMWKCSECGSAVNNLQKEFCTSCGNEVDEFPPGLEDRLSQLQSDIEELSGEASQKCTELSDLIDEIIDI